MKQALLILSLLLFSQNLAAEVYKCVDEGGKTRYQASPCEGVIVPIDEWQPEPMTGIPEDSRYLKPEPFTGHHARRSAAAKNLFKSFHPCPSTGESRSPCPGYVVDHIKALACGGADDPSNMQWQTIEAGKAKDRWERQDCQAESPADRQDDPPGQTGETVVKTGPRGGRYILSPSGRKRYLGRGYYW